MAARKQKRTPKAAPAMKRPQMMSSYWLFSLERNSKKQYIPHNVETAPPAHCPPSVDKAPANPLNATGVYGTLST